MVNAGTGLSQQRAAALSGDQEAEPSVRPSDIHTLLRDHYSQP